MTDRPTPVSARVHAHSWTPYGLTDVERDLVVETPVAIVFNGTTVAVMMASPCDIRDFATGFAVTEGYLSNPRDIESYDEICHPRGIEARFWLTDHAAEAVLGRRRAAFGPMGCGLCGLDSLDEALRPVPRVDGEVHCTTAEIAQAPDLLRFFQPTHDATRSVHAAGFLAAGQGIVLGREDVGRHNALDKLCGAMIRAGYDATGGAIIVTSRLSVDLVQKAAMVNCAALIGVSAPSHLAVETARAAGMTLIANCRGGSFEVMCGQMPESG